MTESQELYNDIASLFSGSGLALVDFSLSRGRGSTRAAAVVYRREGTGIDDCSRAHKLILARLEALLGTDDFQLETASPGIDRTIASPREYALFTGRGVRLFLDDEDIVEGCIVSATGSALTVAGRNGEQTIVAIERIRKGKLDFSQEGR